MHSKATKVTVTTTAFSNKPGKCQQLDGDTQIQSTTKCRHPCSLARNVKSNSLNICTLCQDHEVPLHPSMHHAASKQESKKMQKHAKALAKSHSPREQPERRFLLQDQEGRHLSLDYFNKLATVESTCSHCEHVHDNSSTMFCQHVLDLNKCCRCFLGRTHQNPMRPVPKALSLLVLGPWQELIVCSSRPFKSQYLLKQTGHSTRKKTFYKKTRHSSLKLCSRQPSLRPFPRHQPER